MSPLHSLCLRRTRVELIDRGLCKTPQECSEKLRTAVGYGDRIYLNCHNVNANNRKMFAVVTELVISRGMEITKGIPVTIQAFPKSSDEYVNFKNFFSKDPLIKVEVNK